jgi:hypothetical protein
VAGSRRGRAPVGRELEKADWLIGNALGTAALTGLTADGEVDTALLG